MFYILYTFFLGSSQHDPVKFLHGTCLLRSNEPQARQSRKKLVFNDKTTETGQNWEQKKKTYTSNYGRFSCLMTAEFYRLLIIL